MGCEFDSDGVSLDATMFCNERNSCGDDKIRIIDGHEKSPRLCEIISVNSKNCDKNDFIGATEKSSLRFFYSIQWIL